MESLLNQFALKESAKLLKDKFEFLNEDSSMKKEKLLNENYSSFLKIGYTVEEAKEIRKALLKYPNAEVCVKDPVTGLSCLPKQELDEWEW